MAEQSNTPFETRKVKGRGGDILVEQLAGAGVRFLLMNPSSRVGPILDAMIGRDDMQVILGLQEGVLSAMADGFSKAGGGVPFVMVARPGFPNAVAHLYNAFRDRTPLVLAVDQIDEHSRGQFSIQEVDDLIEAAEPFTRWRWESRRADALAEDIRRAFKFAETPPGGPVFLSIPHDFLAEDVEAEIIAQRHFGLSTEIRPSAAEIGEVADLLLGANSPLLYAGPEIYRLDAEADVVALAELASLPVVSEFYAWANPYPTEHELYLGTYQRNMRYPRDVDLVLNLGGRLPSLPTQARLVHVSHDVDHLGRVHPAALSSASHVGLFARELAAAIRERAPESVLNRLRDGRGAETARFSQRMAEARKFAAESRWDDAPISHERLGVELEQALDPNSNIVHILDSGVITLNYLSFARDGKHCFTTMGQSLGWSLGAALGVSLAQPQRPTVALMGDGDFLFGGSQALWTAQRYRIPILVVVFTNRSYDNERNRIWSRDSLQAEMDRDMTSYIGSPDVRYVEFAAAYGIEAERVEEPSALGEALRRAVEANRAGESYLLDVAVSRRGQGAESTWYPEYSLAAERTRKV